MSRPVRSGTKADQLTEVDLARINEPCFSCLTPYFTLNPQPPPTSPESCLQTAYFSSSLLLILLPPWNWTGRWGEYYPHPLPSSCSPQVHINIVITTYQMHCAVLDNVDPSWSLSWCNFTIYVSVCLVPLTSLFFSDLILEWILRNFVSSSWLLKVNSP